MKKGDLEFLEDLLFRGYLPEELPPLFSTKLLSSITPKILGAEESFKTEPKHSKAIYFSIPKAKDMRRNLCIPNPHHQFMLAKAIVEHWDELQLFYDKSSLSLTKPVRKKHSLRSIQREHPFSEITRQNIIKSTAGRYMLKTDISRYYSTIYTHSISWALHGKNYAKNNSNNRNLLGNVLDFYIVLQRKCQREVKILHRVMMRLKYTLLVMRKNVHTLVIRLLCFLGMIFLRI